jgi:hypothetical protein
MLRPDIHSLKSFKITLPILPPALIAPEETRHTRERLPHHHLTRLTRPQNRLACNGIRDIDVHAQSEYLHFTRVDRSARVGGDEGGSCVSAAGCVAEVDGGREGRVEPTVLFGREGGAGGVDDA